MYLSVLYLNSGRGGGWWALPPLLWCLVVNELIKELNESNFQTEGFSDDLATLVRGKFLNTLCELMQTVRDIVVKWCDKYELSINPEKTNMIVFTRKRTTLDSKLNWKANIELRISPKVMLWIYTTVIRPVILYAPFLWSDTCRHKKVQNKLNKLQGLACRGITGAWKSTPIATMEAMLNLTPLHILIELEGVLTVERITRQGNSQQRTTSHTRNWSKIVKTSPSLRMPTDKITTTYRFDRNFEIYIPSREEWTNGVLPPEHGIVLYTDGSVMNGSAGAGLYCEKSTV